MSEIRTLIAFTQAWVQTKYRNERGEEGMTAEYVVLIGIVVAAAIAIGAILVNKFTNAANGISLK